MKLSKCVRDKRYLIRKEVKILNFDSKEQFEDALACVIAGKIIAWQEKNRRLKRSIRRLKRRFLYSRRIRRQDGLLNELYKGAVHRKWD